VLEKKNIFPRKNVDGFYWIHNPLCTWPILLRLHCLKRRNYHPSPAIVNLERNTWTGQSTFWRHRFGDDYIAPVIWRRTVLAPSV